MSAENSDPERFKDSEGKLLVPRLSIALGHLFGPNYLDSADRTAEVLEELRVKAETHGIDIAFINEQIGRAIELPSPITHQQNQVFWQRHIELFVQDGLGTEPGERWSAITHMPTCADDKCRELFNLAIKDRFMTPEEMDRVAKRKGII